MSGPLAQSVERGADNAKVVSSTLTRTIIFFPLLATVQMFLLNGTCFNSYRFRSSTKDKDECQ